MIQGNMLCINILRHILLVTKRHKTIKKRTKYKYFTQIYIYIYVVTSDKYLVKDK